MQLVETACADPAHHGGVAQSCLMQLLDRYGAVLSTGDCRDEVLWGTFLTHIVTKAPRSADSPPAPVAALRLKVQ